MPASAHRTRTRSLVRPAAVVASAHANAPAAAPPYGTIVALVLALGWIAAVNGACTGSGDSCLYNPDTCGECEPNQIDRCAQSGTIHLTIDDGPFDNSGLALDILKWKQVKATFFTVGTQIPGREALMQRMIAEGHNVQSHSQTHPHLNTLTAAGMNTEMTNPTALIKGALGSSYSVTNFRPPFGECNTACITALTATGMKGTYWNIDSQDWQFSMPLLISSVDAAPVPTAGTQGLIMLIHLENNFGLCALPYIIDRLRFKGYNFVTADQCWGAASKGGAIPVTVAPPTTNPAWPTCTTTSPVVTGPAADPCTTTTNGGCMTTPVYAVCNGASGTAKCSCPTGFTGDGKTSCVCASGYVQSGTGSSAQCVDVNECATNNGGCSASAQCANTAGSRTCTCRSGFTGNGLTCSDVNECATGNGGCDALTACSNLVPSAAGGWADTRTCSLCPEGYTSTAGNTGAAACKNVNECATGNGGCSTVTTPWVQCTDLVPVSPAWAKMKCGGCPTGWTGDGVTCTDVDECADPALVKGGCSPMPQVQCFNTAGSRVCAVGTGCGAAGAACPSCPAGFTGTGAGPDGCVDINECATGNGGCLKNGVGVCTNTIGNRTCACHAGLTGDGITACANIDECAAHLTVAQGGCDPLTACHDATPAAPNWVTRTCDACPRGYNGTGETGCADVNECATASGGCSVLRACVNTPGSRTCAACPAGYTDAGATGCNDVNECATGSAGCFLPDTCANSAGSFSCGACPTGMTGDGKTCIAIRQCSSGNGGCDALTACESVTPTAATGWSAVSCGACPAGFTGSGAAGCVDINECASEPCHNGATCRDGVNGFTCACASGFDGPLCAAESTESAAAAAGRLAVIVAPAVVGGLALIGLAVCGVRYARKRDAAAGAAANANANAAAADAGANAKAPKPANPPPRSANPSVDGGARARIGSPRPAVGHNSLV